jgi:hypothetical protein
MRSILALALTLSISHSVCTQNIPEGYLLQYKQNFSSNKALDDFEMNNPENWGIFKSGSNFYLQCAGADSTSDLPVSIGIIEDRIFGDFILETEVLPLKDSMGLAGICLILGYRNPLKYYYIQLSSFSDSTANGIFLVNKNVKTKLTDQNKRSDIWNPNKWHKVRLVRDIVKRTIIVYLDNMTNPCMLIKDYELIMGSVGFGTIAGTARFDNVNIWAPTVMTGAELKEME